ncbi:hypothetical protein BDV96DRAFT_592948 [Lophiotrema nucula]|uniref:ABM domain-containing protein n=1 Tax=Lophiotrema nucula TaxID=690887 RepID=A0A6A5YE83_9PLEO|nr:hypothetical protein BDV96DRAFT_592948 [Lophiotrema nucula]
MPRSSYSATSRICEWIVASADQTVHIPGTLKSESWKQVLQALSNRRRLPMCEGSYWGRVIEKNDEIWIWSFWTEQDAYEQHTKSELYQDLLVSLTAFSDVPPRVSLLELEGRRMYSVIGLKYGLPSVLLAFFDTALTKDKRDDLRRVKDMRSPYNIIGPSNAPPLNWASRGYLSPDPYNACDGLYVIIDWWSAGREEEVRRIEVPVPGAHPPQKITLDESRTKELRNIGCTEIILRHLHFNYVGEISDTDFCLRGRHRISETALPDRSASNSFPDLKK